MRALFYDLAGSRPVLFLALGAPKEQGHRAGAGMAADGSTHVIDFHFTVQLGELPYSAADRY